MAQFPAAKILLGLLCIVPGITALRFPKGFLFRLVSWRFRDEEASRAAPTLDRLGGILLILLGLGLIFF